MKFLREQILRVLIIHTHKEFALNVGDLDSISALGRSPGGGHGNPLQYSSLENPMDRGGWRATVHGLAKNWTRQHSTTQHPQTSGQITSKYSVHH